MSYVVLARKWRPMSFADLIGQDHVSRTLENAIAQNRVAHAFLFTGVRGVGKTTSARILAKALNCMASDGPTHEPCLRCAACTEITEGQDVDVQEIDGASYNGVDEVRKLQESLPYRPSRDRFKIIIVDEVHMLSQNAWNAFLKTLEEPPPHVKFIFATTEVHKVPITILSRVQRFDFKLIAARQIVDRLRYVLEQEGIAAEEGALAIVARQAAGSMRDAMSLLEQVIAWNDKELTSDAVARVLGVPSRQAMHDLLRAVRDQKAPDALALVDALSNQGFEVVQVATELLGLLRDTVVLATCDNSPELLDTPAEELQSLQQLAEHSTDDLLRLHQAMSRGFDEIARGGQPRAALEMLLIRLCRRPPLMPVSDLVERLIRLEKRLYTTQPGHPARAPAKSAERPAQPKPPGEQRPPFSQAGHGRTPRAQGGASDSGSSAAEDDPAPVAAQPSPAPAPEPALPRSAGTEPPAAHPTGAPSQRAPSQRAPSQSPPEPAEAPRQSQRASAPAPQPRTLGPSDSTQPDGSDEEEEPSRAAMRHWRSLLGRIDDPKLVAFLGHTRAVEATPVKIRLRFDRQSFVRDTIQEREATESILAAAKAQWGTEPLLVFEESDALSALGTISEEDKVARIEAQRLAKETARNHPFVVEAVRVLGARLKNIQLPES